QSHFSSLSMLPASNVRKGRLVAPAGGKMKRSVAAHTLHLRADREELFFQPFIAAIEVIEAVHLRLALSRKARDHQAHRSAQIGGHDFGPRQSRYAVNHRGPARSFDVRTHAIEFG